jgi:hypothetical protein
MLSQIYDLLIESEKEFSNGRRDMGHVLLLEAIRLLKVYDDSNK